MAASLELQLHLQVGAYCDRSCAASLATDPASRERAGSERARTAVHHPPAADGGADQEERGRAMPWSHRRCSAGKSIKGYSRKVVGTLAPTLERKFVHSRTISAARSCALSNQRTNLFYSCTIVSIPCRFSRRASMSESIKWKNWTLPSARVQKVSPSDLEPTSLAKPLRDSSATLHTRRYFSEEPRYYRLGHGSSQERFLYAEGHTFVVHRNTGKHMFNFSEWMGRRARSC
jgi:hypothetical protein